MDWGYVRSEAIKGNIRPFYDSGQWRQKRKQILARDHYSCQRCLGKFQPVPGRRLFLKQAVLVHHIKPMIDHFDLALIDTNLVSLCFACHEEIEGRNNFKPFKKKERLTEEKW